MEWKHTLQWLQLVGSFQRRTVESITGSWQPDEALPCDIVRMGSSVPVKRKVAFIPSRVCKRSVVYNVCPGITSHNWSLVSGQNDRFQLLCAA